MIFNENKKLNKKNNIIRDELNDNLEAFNKIKEEIFNNSYIGPNTIDIVSLIINDIMIDKRLKYTIIKVIDALESNNYLTTLLTLKNDTKYKLFNSNKNLYQITQKYLDFIEITELQNKASFKTVYYVPGFLSFYQIISNYISKNISENLIKNEKKLRNENIAKKVNAIKLKYNYHLEEKNLLDKLSKEINSDESDTLKP